jgi:mRNA interferase YafQ
MKRIITTGKFKKDFKRYRNKPDRIEKLYKVLDMLKEDMDIPQEYNPHKLTGNYNGYMECHIENDLLLILIDAEKDIIKLVRLGSHSELF